MVKSFEKTRNGRKFRMALYCLLLATVGFLAAMIMPALSGLYATYIGALATFLAVYCGGNIGNKYVLTRPDTKIITDRRTTLRKPVVDKQGPGSQG